MPRPRFTIRRMMVAVAIAGVVVGLAIERHNRFTARAKHHFARYSERAPTVEFDMDVTGVGSAGPRGDWHQRMGQKYALAARYPWLPVAPDPPEPE